MKTRLVSTILNASLLIALLAACTPSTSPAETQATQPSVAQPAPIQPTADVSQPTADLSQPVIVESSATLPAVMDANAQPVATSRGDALEATDPSTVSLASGGLHFVEFFRFT